MTTVDPLKVRKDPIYFVEKVIGMKLVDFQKEWLKILMKKKRVCFMAFRSSGKTRQLFVHYFLWKAVTNPSQQFLIISKTLPQAIEVLKDIRLTIVTNPFLKTLVPQNKATTWSRTELELKNHSRILSKAYNENVRGLHVDGCGCDELGEYEDHEILKKAVLPTIRAKRGFFIGVGTPKSELDLLHEIERDPGFRAYFFDKYPAESEEKGNLFERRYPDTKIVHVDGAVEIIDKKSGKLLETYSNLTWAQEFLLKPMSLKDKLFPSHMIEACLDHTEKLEYMPKNMKQYFMGVDFAMSAQAGSDFTVVTVLEKSPGDKRLKIVHLERWKGLDYNLQKSKIKEICNNYKCIKVLGDEGSFGKTFIYDLKADGIPIDGYKFTYQSSSKEEIIKTLRDQLEKKGFIIPYDSNDFETKKIVDILIDELSKFGIIFDHKTHVVKFEGTGKHDDCLCKGALIQTDKGLVPIEKIMVGDKVLTHKGKFKKVWRVVKKPYQGKLYTFTPYNGLPISVTPEHPIYSCIKSNSKWKYKDKNRSKPFWNPKWVFPINFKTTNARTMFPIPRDDIFCPYSDELMWLLGLFTADGSYKENGAITISFNSKDKKLIKKAKKVIFNEFGKKVSDKQKNNCIVLQFGLKKYLHLFDIGKRECRRLPSKFLLFPPIKQKKFYDGYFAGDGYIDSRGYNITATISRELANQIQIMLLRMDRNAGIRELKRKRYDVKNKNQYWVSWKKNKSNNVKSRIYGDYVISAIRSFKESEISDFVYNLEVLGDESYVVETTIVHNCVISLGLANFIARNISMGAFSVMKGSSTKVFNPFVVK
jgi:hypothetical protein